MYPDNVLPRIIPWIGGALLLTYLRVCFYFCETFSFLLIKKSLGSIFVFQNRCCNSLTRTIGIKKKKHKTFSCKIQELERKKGFGGISKSNFKSKRNLSLEA